MRKNKAISIHNDDSRLFYFALFTCIASLVGYMYFVSVSVVDVVMRKETDSQIASLSSSVSQMEAQYIDMQHTVSNDIASLKGFVVADKNRC